MVDNRAKKWIYLNNEIMNEINRKLKPLEKKLKTINNKLHKIIVLNIILTCNIMSSLLY